jgi:hypothetical protein
VACIGGGNHWVISALLCERFMDETNRD